MEGRSMADVEIGRLSLEVPGIEPEQGRRLAGMVATRLAAARLAPARSAERLDVAVAAPAGGGSLEQLAGLIVEQIRRGMA
jgi:hypothetical protein